MDEIQGGTTLPVVEDGFLILDDEEEIELDDEKLDVEAQNEDIAYYNNGHDDA